MPLPNIVVFHHHPCHDGFLAQIIIQRLLSDVTTVTSVPLGHGPKRSWDMELFNTPGTHVMFVDIAPHPTMLDELVACDNIESIFVWDHHIDFRNMYGDEKWTEVTLNNFFGMKLECAKPNSKTRFHFNNDNSGSRLAPIAGGSWAFEFGVGVLSEAEVDDITERSSQLFQHPIVQHASDYDTWKKAIPNTDDVFAYYRNFEYDDITKWHNLLDRITDFDSPGYRHVVEKGQHMNEALRTLANKLATGANVKPLQLEINGVTYDGAVANAYGLLANDVGDILITGHGHDFVVMYNIEPSTLTISVRARPGVPANEIARLWGGGGHAGSAGAGIAGVDAQIDWLKTYGFAQQN